MPAESLRMQPPASSSFTYCHKLAGSECNRTSMHCSLASLLVRADRGGAHPGFRIAKEACKCGSTRLKERPHNQERLEKAEKPASGKGVLGSQHCSF